MRRLLSILLLAVFGLSFALPLLALGRNSDASLPACCRRGGKHHCMATMGDRGQSISAHDPKFEAPAGTCPYNQGSVAPAHHDSLACATAAASIFGDVVSHPTGHAQTEARLRISRDRSNQKRGPPVQTLL